MVSMATRNIVSDNMTAEEAISPAQDLGGEDKIL